MDSREKKPEGEVRTFVDRVIGNVWTVMGLSAWFVSMLALFMPMRLPILFIILLIMGMGTAVTGLVIRFTPTIVGGIAAIILAPCTLLAGNMWQPLPFHRGIRGYDDHPGPHPQPYVEPPATIMRCSKN